MIQTEKRSRSLWCLALAVTVLLALRPGPNDNTAAPWCILVYGDLLTQRAVMADWHENQRFLVAIDTSTGVDTASLRDRPYAHLAMFWGPETINYPRTVEACAQLRPEQTGDYGRFYPAHESRAPVVLFGPPFGLARPVSASGLEILARHGVPIRVDQ